MTYIDMHAQDRDDISSELWPVERDPAARRRPALGGKALSTLADLGMTDAQIARYFKVSQDRVVSLRRYYGLA
jgi:hypothetical protein